MARKLTESEPESGVTLEGAASPNSEPESGVTFEGAASPYSEPVLMELAAARAGEPVIYCGPNLPKENIRAFDVFKGGLPGHVARFTEKQPEISALIVPVSRLTEIKKKTETPGTEEHRIYQAALAARGEIENAL